MNRFLLGGVYISRAGKSWLAGSDSSACSRGPGPVSLHEP